MGIYKITNISNLAGKRDFKYNAKLDIDYIDNMTKKIISIEPGKSVYLTIQSLPLSVHRLRVKNLITVSEINQSELANIVNDDNLKKPKSTYIEEQTKKIDTVRKLISDTKKKNNKKNEDDE
jgi:hypothetical protein